MNGAIKRKYFESYKYSDNVPLGTLTQLNEISNVEGWVIS
jgi:hypothetical protein